MVIDESLIIKKFFLFVIFHYHMIPYFPMLMHHHHPTQYIPLIENKFYEENEIVERE